MNVWELLKCNLKIILFAVVHLPYKVFFNAYICLKYTGNKICGIHLDIEKNFERETDICI